MTNLQENLHLLESTRAATLAMVRKLTQEQADWAPGGDEWSVGEVLDHLLRSEAIYRKEILELVALARAGRVPFIRRGVQDIDFSPSFLPKALLPVVDLPFTLVTMFVPSMVRDLIIRYSSLLKGQSPKAAIPAKGRPVTALVAALGKSLQDTQAVLSANPGMKFETMRIQHPMLGINNVPQLLRLTALHERRHHDQIRKLFAGIRAARAA
jgi:hypothetical protein